MEFALAAPDVGVLEEEYLRLLGYPLGKKLTDRARELVDDARRWYAAHGRPWVYARLADSLAFDDAAAVVEGIRFSSPALVRTLNRSEAHAVVLVGVTAGPELEMRAQELWNEEKPDEYFFLEVFGSAVVEQLVTTVGAQLCAWADPQKMAVLPHYNPGYPEWDVADQSRLLALLAGRWSAPDAGRIESFESGMLRPKKSLLATFGLTRRLDLAGSLAELVPCQSCTYSPCDYRRAAYRRAVVREPQGAAAPRTSDSNAESIDGSRPRLDSDAKYATSRKALARWASERLKLERKQDGSIFAEFRYDGTTCKNMGCPLVYEYRVTLGPRETGYAIQYQSCAPARGDRGHEAQCEFIKDSVRLMKATASDQPLLGKPLDAVLSWRRPTSGAGCYCEAESRLQKWGLVLETIHFALVQQERG